MKTEKKYLEYYKKAMKTGKLLNINNHYCPNGLCGEFDGCDEMNLFEPTREDYKELSRQGLCTAYWASGLPYEYPMSTLDSCFSPLRQNIVLFLAAMNEEL